jgi:group I intron endonuclease
MNININSGIYEIVNILSGKKYIGSSVNMPRRFKQHIYKLNNNIHDNSYLQSSWNKYGSNSFIIQPICYYPKELLIFIEQRCVDTFFLEYNMCKKVVTSCLGVKRSEHTKQKLSKSLTGKKLSLERIEENRIRMFGKKYALGYKFTEEQRKIASKSRLGNKCALGHKLSDEVKKKISTSRSGGHISEKHKEILRISNTGRKHTDEAKKKIGDARRGIPISNEMKSKLGRKVIDKSNNIIYSTIVLAAQAIGIEKAALYAQLHGFNKNKTPMEFL